MADDMGYADVSCYGRPDIETPNIDRIAANGMRFLQGYANSAVCSATRTALITGRYQYRLRIGLEEPLPAGQARYRSSAGASDAAVAAEEGRLWHHADRQMASGDSAEIRAAEERLRSFLRLSRRRHRLFRPSGHRSQRRFLERRRGDPRGRLFDRAVRTARGRYHQRLCAVGAAVPHQPAFQRAALAVGSGGRPGGIGTAAHQGDPGLRRRHAADLSAHDPGDGFADRPRAAGAGCERPRRKHHRHLHQRQWRRALRRHLAVHRAQDRTAGRGLADSHHRFLARANSAGA